MEVVLREVVADDLPAFFEQQADPAARQMVAFTAHDADDRAAFDRYWSTILADDGIDKRTVLVDGAVAGNIVSFDMYGEREVGYWIARRFWGRGVATAALRAFLATVARRPLHARAAMDNAASRRVLEKCGFVATGSDRGYAKARAAEIDEAIFELR